MTSFQKHISEDLALKETVIKNTDIFCKPKNMVTNIIPFFTWGKKRVLRKRKMLACSLLVSSLLPESRVIHAWAHALWTLSFFLLPSPPIF